MFQSTATDDEFDKTSQSKMYEIYQPFSVNSPRDWMSGSLAGPSSISANSSVMMRGQTGASNGDYVGKYE